MYETLALIKNLTMRDIFIEPKHVMHVRASKGLLSRKTCVQTGKRLDPGPPASINELVSSVEEPPYLLFR